MNKHIERFIENELSDSIQDALNAATQALYFSDSADYRSALIDVVIYLLKPVLLEEQTEYLGERFIDELVHYLNPDWNE